MIKLQRSQVVLLIVTVAMILLAGFILQRQLVSVELDTSVDFRPWIFLPALVASIIQEALNPVFSILALKSVNQSTRYFPQWLILSFSTSANSTVPVPAGIPLRAFLQNRVLDIPYTKSASSMTIETIIGYGVTTIIGIMAGLIWLRVPASDLLVAWQSQMNRQIGWGAGLVIGLLLIALVPLYVRYRQRFDVLAKRGWVELSQAQLLPVFGMLGVMLVSLCFTVLRIWAILYALGLFVAPGPLLAALLLSRLAGVLSFVPMGLGVRDASLASLLILVGVSNTLAIAVSALDRVFMTVPYLIGGILATHILGKKLLGLDTSLAQQE